MFTFLFLILSIEVFHPNDMATFIFTKTETSLFALCAGYFAILNIFFSQKDSTLSIYFRISKQFSIKSFHY